MNKKAAEFGIQMAVLDAMEKGLTDKENLIEYMQSDTCQKEAKAYAKMYGEVFLDEEGIKSPPKKLECVRLAREERYAPEIILEFDNGRSHALKFDKYDTMDMVVEKLRLFADQLQHDEFLNYFED